MIYILNPLKLHSRWLSSKKTLGLFGGYYEVMRLLAIHCKYDSLLSILSLNCSFTIGKLCICKSKYTVYSFIL